MKKKKLIKKHKRVSKKSKKSLFIQGHGTYSNETIVAIGSTNAEILAYAKRIKAKPDAIKWIETWVGNENILSESGWIRYQSEGGWTVMWLRPFNDDCWEYWETLIHELVHLVDFLLGDQKRMKDESEARAYQTEFLFRSIRRKLLKL